MTAARIPMVEAACTALAGVAAEEIRRQNTGAKTAVHRVRLTDGRRVVVKLFAETASHTAEAEGRLLRTIAATGKINVPEVIASGAVPGQAVTALITRDVGTSTLGDEIREGRMSRAAVLLRLALLTAAFHSIPVPPGVPLAPRIGEQVSALASHCPAEVFARLGQALETIAGSTRRDRMTWCHGDLHFDNAVTSPRTTDGTALPEYLVDFEAATVDVPEYDLAQTLVTCDALDMPSRTFLAAAYGHPVDMNLLDAYITFQAVRGWTYAACREGRHRTTWATRMHQALTPSERTTRP
ncbi:phosphotransferase [Streptomyces sp. NPDC058157]|uniref:phosphotransferase family protein n=1 Tax=Streptomyces sp. NPDC058157 TaxID=3346360 RepID=UPI0036E9BCE8